MNKLSAGWIIHVFALLHAGIVLGCRLSGIEDELILTILTMIMTLLICIKQKFNIDFTAASVIFVNIIGYVLGNTGASLFSTFISSEAIVHALASTVTTEILGWSIILLTKIPHKEDSSSRPMTSEYIKWIIIATVGIFAIRLGMTALLSGDLFSEGDLMESLSNIIGNTFAIISLICADLIYIRFSSRTKRFGRGAKIYVMVAFILVSSFIAIFLANIGSGISDMFSSANNIARLYIAALITQISLYCIIFMINYAFTTKSEMQKAKGKAHVAQYRYQRLKRQVNPHFLFNSLNALDCLVAEEKNEQASTYIHKLASVYRYMLKSEEEDYVMLQDELTFVGMYIDLMKVRFPEGFEVVIDVRQEDYNRFVLPCSIQLLIENATKHNTVSAENPLIIAIKSDGDKVKVSNNVIPKLTKVQSTGLGQKYIRQQYLDLSGKSIKIEKSDKKYSVTLPLL